MHRNSLSFHYVKVQRRNVLCLLLTCAAAANRRRFFPNSTRLIFFFFFFILWRESELQSRLQQQQQHWAGCNNAEQTQTTCPRQCTAQAKCYLGYACDIDNKTVLLSSPVNRFNGSECFSLWLQTFFHLMHMYLQPLPVSLKH